jgi:REP element-mobilizing transposase RayT
VGLSPVRLFNIFIIIQKPLYQKQPLFIIVLKTIYFNGENFWARGYFVSTLGLDESMVIEYIRNQEKNDEFRDQRKFGM